jgi:hypothetical protein
MAKVKHHTMLVLVGVVAAGIGAMAALYFTHPVQVGAVAGAARSKDCDSWLGG